MAISKRVCILGNYSGRNAGDAAILAGILEDLTDQYRDLEFIVPTLNPQFIHITYGHYLIRPVSLMPWRGSIKFLGFPAWNAMRSSDLILITDAILFDRGLINPLHNYLSTLSILIPMAKRRKISVVLYNVSLGPIKTRAGYWCLKRILEHSDLIILRDDESRHILTEIGLIQAPILKGADSALSATVCNEDRIQKILQNEGILNERRPRIGININCYGDAFIRNRKWRFSKEKLLTIFAKTAEWIEDKLGADLWLFGTQYMDLKILNELKKIIRLNRNIHLFTNREYSYAELTGLFSVVDLLIGMRTHSIILASSVGTPVIGVVNYPKTYSYLKRIGQEDYAIPIQDLELVRLQGLIRIVWAKREALHKSILQAVERERILAKQAAEHLKPYLEG